MTDGLSTAQLADWERDGFLVIEGFVDVARCDELIAHTAQIVEQVDRDIVSIFSTQEQTRTSDEWFLSSGDKVRAFFEADAFDADGNLRQPIDVSINKLGHAMHDVDPVFERFSRTPELAAVASDVGLVDPLLLQSMYIFKPPRIGGEVTCHQDATFLSTEPQSVVGFWFALQDSTIDNGCLWAQPGGHLGPLRQRFVREGGDADGTRFEELDPTPLPVAGSEGLVPLETPAGTLVVLHGLLPHWSGPNRSGVSRHAYSVHCIDGTASYPADNWLQRGPDLPLRGF
ncbi:MAG TPA: phytanoyl-CoA dioxygenase family protein [Acidimicrobiales bacterium]